MVENYEFVEEMGREWTVSADNSPNRSIMALRSFWASRFIPYGHPGPKTSQKAGSENFIYIKVAVSRSISRSTVLAAASICEW